MIAADVGWTLCGANASARAAATAPASAYAHERDWSAEHSACVASLRAEAGHRGAHGFDNDAPEMRAVFVARGPSFRKDGARLVVARDGDSETATALTGRDADAAVSESKDETTTLAGGEVVRRATSSGEVVWRARVYDAIPGADVRWERVVRDGGKTYALGRARGGGTPCASAMDDEDGTIVRAKCASNGGRLGVVNGAFVVSRDASGRVRAHATTEDGRLATMDVDALTRGKGASVAAFPGASGKVTLEPVSYTHLTLPTKA